METATNGDVILASRSQDLSVIIRNEDPEVIVDIDADMSQVVIH